MRAIMIVIFLLTLAKVSFGQVPNTVEKISARSSGIDHKMQLPDTINSHIDTLYVNQQKYVRVLKQNRFNCLLSVLGDTIVKSEDFYFKAELLDIDEDGYKDLRIFIFSNTPNQCDNYLYDKDIKTFRQIEDCSLDITKIKGTQFYCSINKAGCASLDWQSYLSKIENYKLVDYGYIFEQGCDFEIEENPQVVRIYKIRSGKKILVKTLPYIDKSGDMWGTFEEYWQKNFKRFGR